MAIVTVPWTPAASGDVELFVAVDSPAGIHETDEGDNLLSVSVAVAG